MRNFVARLLAGPKPSLSEAHPQDAGALAAIHSTSFQRGWDEDEFRRLLMERTVVAHHASVGRAPVGFIVSRTVKDEAEILSVAMAPAWRGRGVGRQLLDLHLRRLAGLGARTVFLEVDEQNFAACRLYARAGFREVAQRRGYYPGGTAAQVLRRDLG